MAEQTKKMENSEEQLKSEQTVEQDTASAQEQDELSALKTELEQTRAELAAANDKYLRMIAEYDNFRKRSAKERDTIYSDAISDAVSNILSIGDNLARAAEFTDPASVAKGISMMQKAFEETLGKMGVTEIEALGKPFDPQLHNAVMHVEDESVGENEIVEVFQKGYQRGDRVIRFAMVKVAN